MDFPIHKVKRNTKIQVCALYFILVSSIIIKCLRSIGNRWQDLGFGGLNTQSTGQLSNYSIRHMEGLKTDVKEKVNC